MDSYEQKESLEEWGGSVFTPGGSEQMNSTDVIEPGTTVYRISATLDGHIEQRFPETGAIGKDLRLRAIHAVLQKEKHTTSANSACHIDQTTLC